MLTDDATPTIVKTTNIITNTRMIDMAVVRCCHNCEKRHPNCHASCEDYILESSNVKAENDRIRKKKFEEGYKIFPFRLIKK